MTDAEHLVAGAGAGWRSPQTAGSPPAPSRSARGRARAVSPARPAWRSTPRGCGTAERLPDLEPAHDAVEDCCYETSPAFGGPDGSAVAERGPVRWVQAVHAAKMAPEIGATLAAAIAQAP